MDKVTECRLGGGRYELDGLVGRGGVADIYRGLDLRLQRRVAIKALHAERADDAEFRERFRREAQSAASLKHPAIVAVYDTAEGVVGGAAVPYIVMEYVAGRTLREVLDEEPQLPLERGLQIIDGLLQALECSHSGGIVHRDVKPANVMITASGEVKVTDFGIARAIHNAQPTMTQPAQVLGTAPYLSPEQVNGQRVDTRSDVYSTGCVLYEFLTGDPPFCGDSPVSIAYQHVQENPVPPSQLHTDLPRWADRLVLTALRKDPESRYQSAGEMRADVQRAVFGQPVPGAEKTPSSGRLAPRSDDGTSESSPRHGGRSGRKQRRWTWVVATLALLLVIAAVGGWTASRALQQPQHTLVAVPKVVGANEPAARRALHSHGLKVHVTERFSQQPKGEVFKQRPPASSTRPESSTARIFVSQGPSTVTIPGRLIETPQHEAATILEEAGLELGNVTAQFSQQPSGAVVSSDPPPGSAATRGSAVNLVISKGAATVTVPSTVGTNVDHAYSILHSQDLQVDISYQTTAAKPPDTVVGQSPNRGTEITQGSPVTIAVAQAPEQPPQPSRSPPASTPTPDHGGKEHDGDENILDLFS